MSKLDNLLIIDPALELKFKGKRRKIGTNRKKMSNDSTSNVLRHNARQSKRWQDIDGRKLGQQVRLHRPESVENYEGSKK